MQLIAAAGLAIIFNPLSASSESVYVSNYTNPGSIIKLTLDGVASAFASGLLFPESFPEGLAIDGAGNVFVTTGASQILKFTPDGRHSTYGSADSIESLAFDNTGNLFGTSPNFATVFRLPPGDFPPTFADYRTARLSFPTSLAFDGVGNVYVANHGGMFDPNHNLYAGTIEKFSPMGTDLGAFATGLSGPFGLAFDSLGNLFVSNTESSTIEKITPNGGRSVFANAGLNNPKGLAFDSAGNLYVANAGSNTVAKFTPAGVGSVFATGLDNPTFIAIGPDVPEPSTWGMLYLGLPALLARGNPRMRGKGSRGKGKGKERKGSGAEERKGSEKNGIKLRAV